MTPGAWSPTLRDTGEGESVPDDSVSDGWELLSGTVLGFLLAAVYVLVLTGTLSVGRGLATAAIVVGIPNLWVPALLYAGLARYGPWSGDRGWTVVILAPVVAPLHLVYALDPFVALSVEVGGRTHWALAGAALFLQFLQLGIHRLVAYVLDRVQSGADRVANLFVSRNLDRDDDRWAASLLSDTRLWETETVAADRSDLDCDRCDRTAVPGVERTTVGGVAGRPLREETETVCEHCRELGSPEHAGR